MQSKTKISHMTKDAIKAMTFKDSQGRIQVSLPVSGLLLQRLYLAPFLRYYHSSRVRDCL